MVPFHSGMSTCLLRSPVHASHEAWKWGQEQRKDTKRCLLSLSLAAAVCYNWISLPKHKANVPSSIQCVILPGFRYLHQLCDEYFDSVFTRQGLLGCCFSMESGYFPFLRLFWMVSSDLLFGGRLFFFFLFFLFFLSEATEAVEYVLLAVCMLLGSVYVSSCHCPNIWAKVLQRRDSGIVSGSKHVFMLCSFLWQRYCDLGGRGLMLKWETNFK